MCPLRLFSSVQLAEPVLGITLAPSTLSEFITFLTSSPHSHAISFNEFRDFLLLMPRKASPEEIFRYYEVKKFMGDDGRGSARVTMEGSPMSSHRVVSRIADYLCKATLVSVLRIYH